MRKSITPKPCRSGKRAGSSSNADVSAALRILDANANRLREGLRAIEEYVRFARDNAALTRRIKALRHRVHLAVRGICAQDLLRARNSGNDVGRVSTKSENRRTSLEGVAAANFKRCQEAARVLEEYAKLIHKPAAGHFKQIRFVLYTLEKQFVLRE